MGPLASYGERTCVAVHPLIHTCRLQGWGRRKPESLSTRRTPCSHTLIELLCDVHSHAQIALALATRISPTHDVALYTLHFLLQGGVPIFLSPWVRRFRGFRVPKVGFQFLVWEDPLGLCRGDGCPAGHPMPVGACASGAYGVHHRCRRHRLRLEKGHLFLVVAADDSRDRVPLTASQMTASLQTHLKAAGLPANFTMHSFRVGHSLTQLMGGTAVDEIM